MREMLTSSPLKLCRRKTNLKSQTLKRFEVTCYLKISNEERFVMFFSQTFL